MTKLTLSVDEAVVKKAKQIAQAHGTSVSAMFSQFVESMAKGRHSDIRPGRLARQATGLVELPPGKDYKELLTEVLMEKYGITE